jgi:hypothetical protein
MNLNIFKRIADLEAEMLRIRAGQSALLDRLAQLQAAKQTDTDKIAKRRAYARAYYAKKKAEKLAVTA